ncbi:hypothetical protein C0J52_22713 [Blattella germanica]|nr:hypothetical protein C0J52_22713 [Blattella germanica]
MNTKLVVIFLLVIIFQVFLPYAHHHHHHHHHHHFWDKIKRIGEIGSAIRGISNFFGKK